MLDAVTNRTVTVPHIMEKKAEEILYTATPSEWETILKQISSTQDAFPDKLLCVLKKQPVPTPTK